MAAICKQHLEMYFVARKLDILIQIPLKFILKGLIGNKSALVQVMA